MPDRQNLSALIFDTAQAFPDQTLVEISGTNKLHELNYQQLLRKALNYRSHLFADHVGSSATIVLCFDSVLDFLPLAWACIDSSICFVPVQMHNTPLTKQVEQNKILRICQQISSPIVITTSKIKKEYLTGLI